MDLLLGALHAAQPTYSDIGATLAGDRPVGYHHEL